MADEIPETCVGWGSSARVGECFETRNAAFVPFRLLTGTSNEDHPKSPLMAASASILRTQQEQERNKKRQDRQLATRFDPYTKPKDKGSPSHLTSADESFSKPYGVLGAHTVPRRMVDRSPTVQDVLSMVTERERSDIHSAGARQE
jgi:hypothetical protein